MFDSSVGISWEHAGTCVLPVSATFTPHSLTKPDGSLRNGSGVNLTGLRFES